jgi:type I restriction enzyme S subunit
MERYSEYKPTSMQWLKEIPSHWEIKILKRLITYHKSGSWGDEPNYNPHNLTCLRIADYDYDKACFQRKDNYTIRSYKDNEITGRVLHNGDILIEKSGGGEKTPVGRAVYYDLGIPNCMYANFMEKLVVSENIEAKYLVFLLKAAYVNRIVWKYIKY